MDGSIASQLQAIKSQLRGSDDPVRRPITRPSVLFDPKEAADLDLRTILPIAISGLDVLAGVDGRFERYKDTLFSNTSLDVDREKMVPKEEEKINKSISSYLRLLSGHLQLAAALKTLEYLIRRYQVHVFNVDEVILCALPYHDTHAFVRIVQLINFGNNKWGFLEGTKVSGAPPTRKVLVHQCIRDKGVLEAICNYALPTKDSEPSRQVMCFCTALVVEALGSVQKLDDDTVKRVLPFVFNGLNSAIKRSQDAKAGALMVAGLLSSRATLSAKLTNSLIFFIARVAHEDAKESHDLPWLRVTLMAVITIIQSQSVHTLPKKSLMIIADIRDLAGILCGLFEDFNIEKFLALYIHTLVDYSSSDKTCHSALITALEVIPVRKIVGNIVTKVLESCLKTSKNMEESYLHEAGSWATQIFTVISKNYDCEMRAATQTFFQNSKTFSMEDESMLRALCLMFDSGTNITGSRVCNSKLWLSLQHPKEASVRQATLSHIFSSDMLQAVSVDPQLLVIVEDTVIRQLHDRDLEVVQETLSIEGLAELISHSVLLKAFEDVLLKCIDVLKNSASNSKAPFEVAESCLRAAIKFCHPRDVSKMLFPLLLLLPKTWKLNLRALELARASEWPFYHDSLTSFDIDMDDSARIFEDGFITSLNLRIIGDMADTFAENPADNIEWLTECIKDSDPSKRLFLFIIQQAVFNHKGDINGLVKLFEVCFPILEHEWQHVTSKGNISITEEITAEKLNNSSLECLNRLLNLNVKALNANIIVSVCWAFLKAFASKATSKAFDDCKRNNMLESLFIFFASSPLKNIFREHLLFLTSECCNSSVEFLSRFFTNGGFSIDVQIESLHSLACFSSTSDHSATDVTSSNKSLQLLVEFPSILVPLASKIKDIRAAAMNCIEALYNLWRDFDGSSVKNGNDTKLIQYVCAPIFGELLRMIYDQKKLIISDVGFLPSLVTSMLGFSNSLVVPHNIENRFNCQAKDTILTFILGSVMRLSSYAKLMVLLLVKGIGNSILEIEQVKFLFHDLIERRSISHVKPSEPYKKLTEMEIELLCVLVEISTIGTSSVDAGSHYLDHQIKTLQVDGASLEDPAITRPCVATLQSLTNVFYQKLKSETQDIIFGHLVLLFRNDNGNIQIAAKEALLRINVNCSSVVNILELILSANYDTDSCKRKRREKLQEHLLCFSSVFYDGEKTLSFLNSLLDILMLKKDIKNRKSLVDPLFHFLKDLFCKKWFQNNCDRNKEGVEVSVGFSQNTDALAYAKQGILMILGDVTVSLLSDDSDPSIDMHTTSKVKLLVECAHSTEDAVTRNHIFSLMSVFAKISSEWISECTVDLLSVIGEAAIKQNDSQSQHVLENLITAIVPRWLSMANGTKNLLEVFINVLPQVGVNRRLSLMVYLLRTLSEKNSLGTLIALLFRSLALRKIFFSDYEDITDDMTLTDEIRGQWEYLFALEICNQFPCNIWLSSLINLIEEIRSDDQHEHHSEFLLVLHFIMQKLHSTELAFELESGQDRINLQIILGELLGKIILQLQSVQLKRTIHSGLRRHLKELELGILKTVTSIMVPSEFYECITRLLEHGDVHVSKKTLGFLCETLKIAKLASTKHRQKLNQLGSKRHYVDERTSESFSKMCFKLIQLIDCSDDNLSSAKLAAISCVETLVKEFPSNDQICRSSLTVVTKHIMSKDINLASGCLKCMCALINILGSKALPELPDLIKNVLEKSKCIPDYPAEEQKVGQRKKHGSTSSCRLLLPLNILMVLESFIEHLGLFLNPYLEDIVKLLILQNEYVSGSDPRIKSTAAVIRKLIMEKIPVRLTLPHLFKVYPKALDSGDESLSLAFDMLATATSAMDRSSIGSYYSKIFEHCLMALDLRRQHPQSLKNINTVEQNVIRVIIVLTLKLTESMFRPIFLQSLEWAESEVIVNDSTSRSTERAISFFNLVNMLAEHQRSLFVPYFKYLVDGCTCYLTEDPKMNIVPLSKKRKKAIAGEEGKLQAKQLSLDQWHLRALILTSLYKCFRYDTGNYKFLDSTNFQILLKPIVSQLILEPIILPENSLDVPGVEEVDESLVCCLGQMAITVGSDDIWKQLNHEVLMQTRSEQTRARILGLRVIKYLVQHLKEEYVVALPETIPFLGELLEDVELPVRSLAQEIFKELETLTGESLRQYL